MSGYDREWRRVRIILRGRMIWGHRSRKGFMSGLALSDGKANRVLERMAMRAFRRHWSR